MRFAHITPSLSPHTSGVVLLEVLLALALFCSAAAVIMGSLTSSVRAVDRLRLEAQAADLVVSTLSRVQIGMLEAADAGPSPFEEPDLAGWTWQLVITKLDPASGVPMRRVEAIIANADHGYTLRQGMLVPDTDALPVGPGAASTTGGSAAEAAP